MRNGIHSENRQSGFSMIELVVVVMIILIVSAIAVPNMIRMMREYRLNNAATEVSNLIQQARYQAVSLNRDVAARATCPGVPLVLWVDLNNNGVLDAGLLDLNGDGVPESTEASVAVTGDIGFAPPGAPGPASMGAAYAGGIPPNCGGGAGTGITFNSRGVLDFPVGAMQVYMFSMGYNNQPQWGYRAITVTAMGKVKMWKGMPGAPWSE